jgi:hypothetical protein
MITAVDQASALVAEELDRLERQHAVGPVAVGHDLLVSGQGTERGPELAQRYRARARDVAGHVLRLVPQVQNGDLARPDPREQLPPVHRGHLPAPAEVLPGHLAHLGQPALGQVSERHEEGGHGLLGQPVVHVLSLLARLDQPGLPQHPQMGARVLDGELGQPGELLDRLLAVTQELHQLEPLRAGDGLAGAADMAPPPR